MSLERRSGYYRDLVKLQSEAGRGSLGKEPESEMCSKLIYLPLSVIPQIDLAILPTANCQSRSVHSELIIRLILFSHSIQTIEYAEILQLECVTSI